MYIILYTRQITVLEFSCLCPHGRFYNSEFAEMESRYLLMVWFTKIDVPIRDYIAAPVIK